MGLTLNKKTALNQKHFGDGLPVLNAGMNSFIKLIQKLKYPLKKNLCAPKDCSSVQ